MSSLDHAGHPASFKLSEPILDQKQLKTLLKAYHFYPEHFFKRIDTTLLQPEILIQDSSLLKHSIFVDEASHKEYKLDLHSNGLRQAFELQLQSNMLKYSNQTSGNLESADDSNCASKFLAKIKLDIWSLSERES